MVSRLLVGCLNLGSGEWGFCKILSDFKLLVRGQVFLASLCYQNVLVECLYLAKVQKGSLITLPLNSVVPFLQHP